MEVYMSCKRLEIPKTMLTQSAINNGRLMTELVMRR
jgi:hypothetical protein